MRLSLYSIFHLNMAYSSIDEEQRPAVIERCYWPLLGIAQRHEVPLGIEVSGHTLESIAALDPRWIAELRNLTTTGLCELIGSGYTQLIGPLIPAEVNAANLRLGHNVYERLLGFRPEVALVNEQAYSAGLVQHYVNAGYRAIIMEWDNPARYHPEWKSEWRYLPQFACGQHGEEIQLIWNKSIAFQKFQRYAHGELELDDYLGYLHGHLAETSRAFPLYGNDVEIFDFRPGRYHTEAALCEEGEWRRIEQLFRAVLADGRFRFVRPSEVLKLMRVPGAGNRLGLESPEQPTPVKKQGKYNITRWALTGRDDTGINTACYRLYHAMKANPSTEDADWRELCYLWSSDFRTHITENRWNAYRAQLAALEERFGVVAAERKAQSLPRSASSSFGSADLSLLSCVARLEDHFLTVETETLKARLNCRRGLAVDGLWFKGVSEAPLVGTLPHGYYDDIAMGADYYTGHLVLESPGQPKVTDLNPVVPVVEDGETWVEIGCAVSTPLGPVRKSMRLFKDAPRVDLEYCLDWDQLPLGSLRLGHITLNPQVFERSTLFYSTHNGGFDEEIFSLGSGIVDHGAPVSFLVSAAQGLGITSGMVRLGDAQRSLQVLVDKSTAALIGQITCRSVGESYFCRLALSARELDETCRASAGKSALLGRPIRLSLTAG